MGELDDKFEDCKKEIRSILLPYQKGVYLVQFARAYREMIGRALPFREFGYKSDIDFLSAMPDVVRVTSLRGEYHLQGIADSSTKHIQKMVAKQKPSKLKAPPPRYSSRSYSSSKPTSSYFSSYSSKPFVPRSYVTPPRFSEHKKAPPEPEREPVATYSTPKPVSNLSPRDEVIALVQHFKNNLAIDDVLSEYSKMYHKSLSLSTYGFSSVEECIDDIPELEIVQKNNVHFVRYCSESQAVSDEVKSNGVMSELSSSHNSVIYDKPSFRNTLETTPTKSSEFHSQNQGNLPTSLREKLEQVARSYPEGIWSADFPKYFEEVTGYPLELGDLGYRGLSDLIDEASDIFSRRAITGSRKDYIIYPTGNIKLDYEPFAEAVLVDRIIVNIRKMLEGYPEGIKLNEVLNIYNINCKDSLHISDFGFSDLNTFLMSIKNRVPLKFDTIDGEKSIHLIKMSDDLANFRHMIPESCENEAIPFDAAFDFEFKPLSFPPDFDFTKFVPGFTSSVTNAGLMHIQLEVRPDELNEFLAICKELDAFYEGGSSEQYMMKNAHIKVGACCVAKWPVDQRWYRTKILSIPSMQEVYVRYVDYGTEDIIPKYLLRYAKKKHTKIPAVAVKCRLAYIRPPNNATKWNVDTRDRILDLCEDLPMMVKVASIQPDGVCSVVLCDTNGKVDVYINDLLCNEGLAVHDIAKPNQSIPVSEPQEQLDYYHNLNPLQAIQAKMYLQSFAAIAPSFALNEHYIKLLKQVSIYCPSDTGIAPQNIPVPSQNIAMPSVGPPGFSQIPSAVNASSANHYLLQNAFPGPASAVGSSPIKRPTADPVIQPPLSISAPEFYPAVEGNGDGDNEIFDDDEEMFREFCDKNTSVKMQYVKRVHLGDGYKIHIIVCESKPYASSGDISQLIWNNKEADYLFRRLQIKDVEVPFCTLSEDGNEELFEQLSRYKVKGVQKTTGFKSSVLIYPLKVVIKILNIFGHPSVTLRTRISEEIANFNPYEWKEYSPDTTDTEEESTFTGATDDAKLERLCLYDLLAMKEALACRRKKSNASSSFSRNTHPDEPDKNELMYQKVLQRIQEIKEICQVFT